MRILHCFLILASAILLTNVYCDSSNPLPKSPLNYLSSLQRAPPNPQVTSYTLAAQWPPGVCTGNSGVTCKIKPVPTEFTIHGLWPQPDGAPIETFDANKIATLATELNKNWPNLKSAQQSISINLAFWRDEWTKHGKYSGLGVREYFEKSLQLLKDGGQGLKAKLAAEKITPSIYKTYKLAEIQAAVIKINGGLSGTIICVQRQGSSKKQQIQEIRFKYTKDFRKQNNSRPSNCGPEILFPAPGFGLTEVVSMPEIHHRPI